MNAKKINHRKRNQIIEGAWKIDFIPTEGKTEYFYLPNSSGELLLVLKGSITRTNIGSSISFELIRHNIYLPNARSKGAVFTIKERASLLLIRLNSSTLGIFRKKGLLNSHDKIRTLKLPIQNPFVWKKYIDNLDIAKIFSHLDMLIIDNKPKSKLKNDGKPSDSIKIIGKSNCKVLAKDPNQKMNSSKSTVELEFNNEVNISPKELCRIEKLNHSIYG